MRTPYKKKEENDLLWTCVYFKRKILEIISIINTLYDYV